jgi:hypothetical protein
MSENPLPEPIFSALLDVLIPARSPSLPGAGSLGLAAYVEPRLGEGGSGVTSGLGALDARANESHGADFSALAEQAQVELVKQVGAEHPGFVESLLFHLYTGYYEHPRVVEALGLESRPPFPKGYPLEAGDLGLLDSVRARTGLFREA